MVFAGTAVMRVVSVPLETRNDQGCTGTPLSKNEPVDMSSAGMPGSSGSGASLRGRRVSHAEAEREQRVVAGSWPTLSGAPAASRGHEYDSLPVKSIVHRAVFLAEQHVGDAAAFGAGQPGRDVGLREIQFAVLPQRTTRQQHRRPPESFHPAASS